MKRSLLTVCSLLLAAGLAGCAVEERGDDGLPLGESQSDLSVGTSTATAPAATQDQAETPPDRPEPEPWRSVSSATNRTVVPGPRPAPDGDPRRFASDAVKAAGGEERPEPEPWQPKDTTVSLTKNK